MQKMQEKLAAMQGELEDLEADLKAAKAGKTSRGDRKLGSVERWVGVKGMRLRHAVGPLASCCCCWQV
jgi:hypothetical protein